MVSSAPGSAWATSSHWQDTTITPHSSSSCTTSRIDATICSQRATMPGSSRGNRATPQPSSTVPSPTSKRWSASAYGSAKPRERATLSPKTPTRRRTGGARLAAPWLPPAAHLPAAHPPARRRSPATGVLAAAAAGRGRGRLRRAARSGRAPARRPCVAPAGRASPRGTRPARGRRRRARSAGRGGPAPASRRGASTRRRGRRTPRWRRRTRRRRRRGRRAARRRTPASG